MLHRMRLPAGLSPTASVYRPGPNRSFNQPKYLIGRIPSLTDYARFCELKCRVMYRAMSAASVKHSSFGWRVSSFASSSTIFSYAIGAAS